MTRQQYPMITQDFGYNATQFASKSPGEIGGKVWRSSTSASIAMPIEPTTLDQPISASGTLALIDSNGQSGVLFGFFNHEFTPGQRPTNSILFHVAGEKRGAIIHLRAINVSNQSSGTPVQRPGAGKKDRLFPPDGAIHHWSLKYDPATGQLSATFDDLAPATVTLATEFRKQITLDRFGLLNEQKSGRPMTFYLGELEVNGKKLDLSSDPGWEGVGNRRSLEDRDQAGDQDFGYRATNSAGGDAGEIGGTVWRREPQASWYADKIETLDFDHPLHASGKVTLQVGAPDSGVLFGWFNSKKSLDEKPHELHNFIGVRVEGPTRVGHYFAPTLAGNAGKRRLADKAPVLVPDGKSRTFQIDYDPAAGTSGVLRATLDGQSVDFPLKPQDRTAGATFDRFGLLAIRTGGNHVKIFLDDLSYSAGK